MKTTVIPAQVTTVEDRVFGNLGLSQLLLLAAPVFGGSALYIILPPSLHSATYKLVVMALLAGACGLLAIRVRGKIILLWLVVLLRYNLRARYYVYNKNSLALRASLDTASSRVAIPGNEPAARLPIARAAQLSSTQLVSIQTFMSARNVNLHLKPSRKGGLRVLISQSPEES